MWDSKLESATFFTLQKAVPTKITSLGQQVKVHARSGQLDTTQDVVTKLAGIMLLQPATPNQGVHYRIICNPAKGSGASLKKKSLLPH